MSGPNAPLPPKDAPLYGARNTARSKRKEISSSSTVAFSSTLAGLIKASSASSASSAADGKPTAAARARPHQDDMFKTHNRNVKKRALADLDLDPAPAHAHAGAAAQKHRGRSAAEKDEDAAAAKRTQRRMEEKARLYAALKRGDVEDLDDRYGVDFDRKWADAHASAAAGSPSSSDDDGDDSAHDEHVEYVDEFGRTRKGTRADALREERRKRTLAHDAPDRFTARPTMPDTVIYGDTIQTNAFNPDESVAQHMAHLAARRDKDLTPPPDLHFDGRAEARTRGTAFLYFDQDEAERQKQMANLVRERAETERMRQERKHALAKRKDLIREKKQRMAEKRSKAKAEKFLDQLAAELAMPTDGPEDDNQRPPTDRPSPNTPTSHPLG